MRTTSRFLGILVPFLVLTTPLFARFEIALVEGGTYSMPSIKTTGTAVANTSGLDMGAGVLAYFSGGKGLSTLRLEVGVLYMPLTYTLTGTTTKYSLPLVEAPVIVRFLLGTMFSLGFGGYFKMGMGNVVTAVPSTSSPQTVSSTTFAANNFGTMDYGIIGSVAAEIRLSSRIDLLLDLRYQIGLANFITTVGNDYNHRLAQLLVGLKFPLSGADRGEDS